MTMTATDRDQDQDRKCDKMKLYSSGNCCYVEETRKKPCPMFDICKTGAFLIRNSIKTQQPFLPSARLLRASGPGIHGTPPRPQQCRAEEEEAVPVRAQDLPFTVLCLIMVKVSGS